MPASLHHDPTAAGALAMTYARMRASLDPCDVVTWLSGVVHADRPGLPRLRVFDVEGFVIARAVRSATGWDVLARVALTWLAPGTHQPLERFVHPVTGEQLDVMHVWNDPCNHLVGPHDPAGWSVDEVGPDVHLTVCASSLDPHPLPPHRWPRESSGELLSRAAVCRMVSPRSELRGSGPSVACTVVVSGASGWLPWMAMGGAPGQLAYQLGGAKIGPYGALPERMRRRVEENRPEFAFAPSTPGAPDESTWTRYAAQHRPLPPAP